MTPPLPPGLTGAELARALDAMAAAVGPDAVLRGGPELDELRDPYWFAGWHSDRASAAVLPATVEQVRAVVRVAGEHRLPLWPVSQGRNYAYGGASPCVPGSVVVSLRRMDRVLEVDEELAFAAVEPGVRFFDLYEHLRTAAGGRLWPSVPVLGWGSVVGNALDHGWGYTPNGDHAANVCGLEVVLPDGDVVRTGMGALSGGRSWHVYRRGFGPSPDGLFMQSNLGIVTRMGVWLMPRPERYVFCRVRTTGDADLGPLVEAVRPLLLQRVIEGYPLLGPEPGWRWALRFALYGHAAVVEAQLAVVRRAFAAVPGAEVEAADYAGAAAASAAEPIHRVLAGVPGLDALGLVRQRGGEHGGQIDFSPVSPLTAADAVAVRDLARPLLEERGFDYTPGVVVTPRSLVHVCPLTFDTTDEERARAAFDLYPVLVRRAAAAGYGVYRAHVRFMDLVAATYDFGDGAQRRFNRAIKAALDPAGILAPGKSGI